jgi:hypothetical protein
VRVGAVDRDFTVTVAFANDLKYGPFCLVHVAASVHRLKLHNPTPTPSMNALKRVRNMRSGDRLRATANLLEGPVSTFKELEPDTPSRVALE